MPSYKSSRPSHYRLAASTSSPTSADLGDSARTTATVNPAPNSMDSTYLDPLAPMFIPRFVSTPASATTHPFTSVLLPVGPTHPSAVDEEAPSFDEFLCGRAPEFELDEETQLKVPAPSPNLE